MACSPFEKYNLMPSTHPPSMITFCLYFDVNHIEKLVDYRRINQGGRIVMALGRGPMWEEVIEKCPEKVGSNPSPGNTFFPLITKRYNVLIKEKKSNLIFTQAPKKAIAWP